MLQLRAVTCTDRQRGLEAMAKQPIGP
eukprot:SAG31_NODE_36889_length_309_cov_0.961905_1_plen_26_part_10